MLIIKKINLSTGQLLDRVNTFLPVHCLNIEPVLLDEQLKFCNNDQRVLDCDSAISSVDEFTETFTEAATSEPCFGSCVCTTQGTVNLLECTATPTAFTSNTAWSFVHLAGNSTKSISDLRLQENATLVATGLDHISNTFFGTDFNYQKRFRLSIQNSSLESLVYNTPFQNKQFSRLEFVDSAFGSWILTGCFADSTIDLLSIESPKSTSMSVRFQRSTLIAKIRIRKFQIKEAYKTFRQNSPDGTFGLDRFLLNIFMFEELEELEITNTFLDFIEASAMSRLTKLVRVRLENVYLKNVINTYFSDLRVSMAAANTSIVEYQDKDVNWMANTNLKHVYLGREQYSPQNFSYTDEDLCYFVGLNSMASNTIVFVYDTIDFIDGIECSCTILWFYHRIDLEYLISHESEAKYVPKCVQRLKTSANVKVALDACLGKLGDPNDYCRYLPASTTPATTDFIVDSSSTEITSTRENENDSGNENYPKILNMLIVVLVFVIIVFMLVVSVWVYLICLKKKNQIGALFDANKNSISLNNI